MSALALSRAHKAELRTLTNLAEADLQIIWQRIATATDATVVRDNLATILPKLVAIYGAAAATLAADYYDELRAQAGIAGRFTAVVAELPDEGRSEALAGWAVGPLFAAIPDHAAALTLAAGGLQRIVADASRDTIKGSAIADPKASRFVRSVSGGACDWCSEMEGTEVIEGHDHCVVGSTLVAGPTVEARFRRWYEGELVIIGLAGDQELAITPNHPVLTDRGWVEPDLLGIGDQVVKRSGADLTALHVPHEYDVPAHIEDEWRAHSMDRLARMPATAEDFHGDGRGTKGEVEVVASDGFLSDVGDARFGEHRRKPVVGSAVSAVAAPLSTSRDLANLLVAERGPLERGVGGLDFRHSVFGGRLCKEHSNAVLHAATISARLPQPSLDSPAGNAETISKTLLGLACEVSGGHFRWHGNPLGARALARGSRFDPPPTQSLAERRTTHANLGGRLLERLAGGIESSAVIEVRRVDFSGHVFNLQTVEGWYEANGVVVSNCNCGVDVVWS